MHHERTIRLRRRATRWTVAAALCALAVQGMAASGSIHPEAIEIDESANLHAASNPCGIPGFVNGAVLNAGATVDWVADCDPNTDPPSLVDSVATGVKTSPPDQTGAVAVGHWNGVRIVDGVAGDDQDIFQGDGKENDTDTWNIGPGTVGSSKYDITQAYLANNQTTLFFGMERRGHNGTTAFDFEFNQVAPDAATPLIPTRTVDDILFTFELQGSGGSGSAASHVYQWDGSRYVELIPVPGGVFATINQADTPAAPWGYVDRRGRWTTGNIPRFELGEAAAPLTLLPGVDVCGGSAFVQVRTRASSAATSDLKDTTRVFRFVFAGPSAAQALTPACEQFSYDGSGSTDSNGGSDLTHAWEFTVPAGTTLSGGGVTQDPDDPTVYHSAQVSGTVDVALPEATDTVTIASSLSVTEVATGCVDASAPGSVTVISLLPGTAAKTGADGARQTVRLGGVAPGATSVQFQRFQGGAWVAVGSPTEGDSAQLDYSGFEQDATPSAISFAIGADSYEGLQWQVGFRLRATRTETFNGTTVTCESVSPPVTVKKVTAVDP